MKTKILLLFFALILGSGVMYGCAGDNGGGNNNGGNNPPPIPNNSSIVINNFEKYEDVMMMGYVNNFGAFSINKDKAYITEGDGSLRLEVWGEPGQGVVANPIFNVFTTEAYSTHPKTDFSDINELIFDVYNASDRDINIYFGFKGGDEPIESNKDFTPKTKYVLPKNQWTNVKQPFVREYLSLNYDITNITRFTFVFDNRKKDETPALLYFDNFCGNYTTDPIPEYNRARKSGQGYQEILNFDNITDTQLINTGMPGSIFLHHAGNPMMSIARSSNGKVYEGTGSLKVEGLPYRNNPYAEYNDSTGFEISGGVLKGVQDMTAYSKISMMWYNAWDRNILISVSVTSSAINPNTGLYIGAEFGKTLLVDSWTTVEISKQELAAAGLDIKEITGIRFNWVGVKAGANSVFYLDDVKYIV